MRKTQKAKKKQEEKTDSTVDIVKADLSFPKTLGLGLGLELVVITVRVRVRVRVKVKVGVRVRVRVKVGLPSNAARRHYRPWRRVKGAPHFVLDKTRTRT
jgi:hypothetical protein